MPYRKTIPLLFILSFMQGILLDAQTFSEISTSLPGLAYGSLDWGDYDSDGDLDLLVCGASSSGGLTQVFRNDGGGVFTEQSGIVLTGSTEGEGSWGDFDNDGDLDILISGYTSGQGRIYRNEGAGVFSEVSDTGLPDAGAGSSCWGDYDNDGDLDILIAGRNHIDGYLARVYQNQGSGSFREMEGIRLTGVQRCTPVRRMPSISLKLPLPWFW